MLAPLLIAKLANFFKVYNGINLELQNQPGYIG